MTAHREPAYAARGRVSLPVSEAASDGSLILPLYGDLTANEQDQVVATLLDAVESMARSAQP
jgi:dTDP-4-amino-4,6-dideoxygalactose transaminase